MRDCSKRDHNGEPEGQPLTEHGRAPDPEVQWWQDRLTPAWKRIAGGCHLNRKMDDLVLVAGFRLNDLRTGYLLRPKPLTFLYEGQVRRG